MKSINKIQFDKLLQDVLHGDEEHKQWLTDAFNAAWNGTPVPPPRGSGTKDRLYNELILAQARIATLALELEELRK
jgi:hypothetical protein